MGFRRGLFFVLTGAPAVLHAACSASNGDAIPVEVHDASALDVGSTVPERDAGPKPGDDASTPKDAGKDVAPSDAQVDAPPLTSEVVRIAEVYVDRSGGGDGTEYVELRGPAGTPVDDLILRLVDTNGNVDYEVDVGLAGAKIGATGTWVVGGGLVTGGRVDRTVSSSGWGLDTRGAVQLVRGGNKTLLDVVGYTTVTDGGAFVPQPATNPKSTGEGSPYLLPAVGAQSFGRKPADPDTNDNKADFCTMAKSAGSANGACQ